MIPLGFSRRSHQIEEMDRPDCPDAALLRTLAIFALINRLVTPFRRLLRRHVLAEMLDDPSRDWHLVDLGTGGGDVPRWLAREARRLGLRLSIRAIERDPRAAAFARQRCAAFPEITVVEADACDPEAWGQADFAFAQHFLHHLSDDDGRQLLSDLDRSISRTYVVSDLRRSILAYGLFGLVSLPFRRGSFIATDGLASIRRGFTVDELRSFLRVPSPHRRTTVFRMWPFRVVVVGCLSRMALT